MIAANGRVQSFRRLPHGAEVQPTGGVHFRVWAPDRRRVAVVLDDGPGIDLEPEAPGWFAGLVGTAGAGTRYRYRLDGGDFLYPDPASRFQPEGPHGPSEVIDPTAFEWTDRSWTGIERRGTVLYEMHVGTFTTEGTFAAALEHLPALREIGVTCLELMPLACFPGDFGWGYDGVDLFAPYQGYGRPDDVRRFVDRAHALGLGVVHDVVYNHLGPDGNYLKAFSKDYFTDRYENEWGEAVNFDGPDADPVRAFMAANAAYWIDEFHMDGLRIDATQQIFDSRRPHVIKEIADSARAAAGNRSILLIGENESQNAALLRPCDESGDGCGLDALWNDDLHHAAVVALTGRREAYYTDYKGTAQELVSCARWGFLYQGQRYVWQGKRRGTCAFDIAGAALVAFLQNHDQVANSARGWRIDRLAGPARLRALTTYMLLIPATPMLFQGQEFAVASPFHYFADHEPGLAGDVHRGRAAFLAQFETIGGTELRDAIPAPHDRNTFLASKLDHTERTRHPEWVRLHADLLRLRREDPVFASQDASRLFGAVLGPECFVLRFLATGTDDLDRSGDRLLIVNLGADIDLAPAPEPLLAPPASAGWTLLWASEDPRYGGLGQAAVETPDGGWRIPGRAAVVLRPGRTAGPEPKEKETGRGDTDGT